MNSRGFTLIEMLAAVLIVGLCVPVFFQLLSASLKLEHKGRHEEQVQLAAAQLFEVLLACDVRKDDFEWEGEIEKLPWSLKLFSVEIAGRRDRHIGDGLFYRLPRELYRFALTVFYGPGKNKKLELFREKIFKPGYFSDDFKEDHIIPFK